MASSSHKVIYAALTANVLIAIAKFVTAAITGSSSMLAEGISSHPAVDAVGQVLTMQLGPESVLVNIDVRFKPQGSLGSLENTIRRVEDSVREVDPAVQHVFLEASSLQVQQG